MIKLCIILCSCGLLLLNSLTTPLDSEVFDKFHQSDYKLKFERVESVSYNKDVLKRFEIVTFKPNRTCAAVNFTMEFIVDVGDKLELIAQTYKFMSNEYRYFPIRLEISFCDAISKDLGGLGDLSKCGNLLGCSLPKDKTIRMCNWKPNGSNLPPFIPDGKYMVELQTMLGSVEVSVFRVFAEIYRPII